MKMQKNKSFKFLTFKCFFSTLMSFLLLSVSANLVAAEYVYISDNLRVGVRTEPVSGIPPIGVVFTGMKLEVHEKMDGYVRITTNKGLNGWIKDIYVTKKAPAIIQLNAFRAKYDKLKKELSQGSDTSEILEKANLALSEKIDDLKAERREWARERASLLASQYKDSSSWGLIVAIISVVLSFFAGVFWYKRLITKRLGGLRI